MKLTHERLLLIAAFTCLFLVIVDGLSDDYEAGYLVMGASAATAILSALNLIYLKRNRPK